MKAKLAGLLLLTAMPLAALSETYHFTPIVQGNGPGGPNLLLDLGDQLTMNVAPGTSNNALFTFTNDGNGGDIHSVITRVYVDDSPSNLFSAIAVANDSGADVAFSRGPESALPGANGSAFSFRSTAQFNADSPHPFLGVNNTTASAGDFLTLSAILNAGRTFADVINSLNAGNESDNRFLRIGLRVTSIDAFDDLPASYLDDSAGGAAPPPPIPEAETYGMLLAGLGLLGALLRRRGKG